VRTAFFVDGYNLFYGLLAGTEFKWLNLRSLLAHVAHVQEPSSELVSVSYFTSGVKPDLATRGVLSKQAQDTYIRALKTTGVEVSLGASIGWSLAVRLASWTRRHPPPGETR